MTKRAVVNITNQNEALGKHPGCALTLLGMATAGAGIFLIWIPFIGIPLILIGLGVVVFGILTGIVKTIQEKIKKP